MSDDPRLQELLDELLSSQRTPEEVCASFPELLPQLRHRWKQLYRIDSELDLLFPPSTDGDPCRASYQQEDMALPQIAGYEVDAVLGRGGMGVVYRARHLRLNRVVALKMLLAGPYAGTEDLERFMCEAEAVAGLHHPNIVQLYDAGEIDGRPYFTMEPIDGGGLAQKLAGTPLPSPRAAELLIALADAVEVAHRAGIIHRDLKPGNVLLTADGTPKVTDFGLARRLENDDGHTLTGAPMGTPSYMAPEQARGDRAAIAPATDVYSLGAILYEMLTGRPPFRAGTSSATLRQVIADEPVPPARLNPQAPRDLETICLKCLSKDPNRRYLTAASLADDVRRYQRGEPISARRPGTLERLSKWVRRRPSVAALIAASALFATILIGGWLWITVQQQHRRQTIEADLRDANHLQQEAKWAEADVALQRAEATRDGGGPWDLHQRISQARRDLNLVSELESIRLSRLTSGNLVYYRMGSDRRYAEAFEKSGLATMRDDPDVVARRIDMSVVRVAIVAALDDWAVCAMEETRRDWLLKIAREADRDPSGWADRIRDSDRWDDVSALSELAETVPVSAQSVSLLLALGERLARAKGDAPNFLRRVQRDHPADFWANMVLGNMLVGDAPVEASGYYRAALASRPHEAVTYTSLGDSLKVQGRTTDAIEYYRRALQIDPNYARGHTNLGNILRDTGQEEEAIACYEKALQIDPNYAWAHLDLANALRKAGQIDESLEHYKKFYAVDQSLPDVANMLRSDLVRHGRGEEARLEWKKQLELDSPQHGARYGYAELCLFLGDEDEYRRARQDLLRRFGHTKNPYVAEQIARAVLLAPPADDELSAAVSLADCAVAAQWVPATNYRYFLFAKGLAEYRQGNFDSAIATMNGKAASVLVPCPRLVAAMAQYRLGHEKEARATLADAISAADWRLDSVRSHDQWLMHPLRREAESIILPKTDAFLKGSYEPQDNDERLALTGICQFKDLRRAEADLYAAAFHADPKLAEDLKTELRHKAACAAAVAGCGGGADGAATSEQARARWRERARAWLQADLDALASMPPGANAADRARIQRLLRGWKFDPQLAGVRDANSLQKYLPEEQNQWRSFWKNLDVVINRLQPPNQTVSASP